ncbi:SpoIIE family protein phosphatase [Streptomyces sodiiphilus]|uniref:SpoIIE family protein phosphatase n=1 Tax=Streptomyces sodiiphilus TaxID=226217 RepID=UPI0031D84425
MSTSPSAERGSPAGALTRTTPHTLLDVLRSGVVMMDARGRILLWSPTTEEILGWSDTQVVGRHLTSLLPEGAPDPGVHIYRSLHRETRWQGTLTVLHRDGRPVELYSHAALMRDSSGTPFILANLVETERLRPLEHDLAALDALFSASPLGIGIFDTDRRLIRVNEALCRLQGVSAGSLLGRTLPEILPSPGAGQLERIQEEVLETGRSVIDLVTIAPDGRGARSVSLGRLTDGSGKTLGVGCTIMDITERREALEKIERARQRLSLLDDVGIVLGDHLDVRRIAETLAQILVPRFGDYSSVLLFDAVAHGGELPDPDRLTSSPLTQFGAAARTHTPAVDRLLRMGQTVDFEPESILGSVLTSGNPALVGSRELRAVSFAQDPRVEAAHDLAIHSLLTVPLRARGTVLGLLIVSRAGERDGFDHDDLALAMEIANRASISLDNARLYTRERESALMLQRSLLPQHVPSLPGVRLGYRYVPSSSQSEAGGDWFDVIPLTGGRTAFVVGDVMGHSLRAAATMGRLRTAVRTLAGLGLPPAELLHRVNGLADDLAPGPDEPLMATCAYAVHDPARHSCTIALAGHPPPVLMTSGRDSGSWTAAPLDLPTGGPLGVEGVVFEERELQTPLGAILVLYTDGLIEKRGEDITAGIDRLSALLSTRTTGRTPSLDALCEEVLAALGIRPGENGTARGLADDIALLVAQVDGLPGAGAGVRTAAWTFPAEPPAVRRVRAAVRQTLLHWNLLSVIDDSVLMVSELFTNALRYAHGPVEVRMERGSSLRIEVSDPTADPPLRRAPGPEDEGGRGLQLVARESLRWGTRPEPPGKTVWFELGLPPEAGAPPR